MKVKYFFLIIFIGLIGCKSKDNALYEFDPRYLEENKITLSEIADDILYIPLDNSYPLGVIYAKVKFINNTVYLSAKDIGILAFNKQGETLRKIGNKGRGPGEYVYNYSFTIDDKTESVYVCDVGNIVKVYSKEGEYLRSFSLRCYGDFIQDIEIYNSGFLVSFPLAGENIKYKWILLDTLGNLTKSKKRLTPIFTSSLGGSGGIIICQNEISLWDGYFTDTVFSFLPDLNERPSFIISPGEHRFPKSKFIHPNEISKYLLIKQIFETKQFLAVKYIYKTKKDFVIIDKKDNRSFTNNNWEFDGSGGIYNDLDGGTRFLPVSCFTEKGREYMVGLQYSYQIKAIVESDEFKKSIPKYPEKKKELETLANSLKETDNPVVMIVRLKK